jgi:hypothetical protein
LRADARVRCGESCGVRRVDAQPLQCAAASEQGAEWVAETVGNVWRWKRVVTGGVGGVVDGSAVGLLT